MKRLRKVVGQLLSRNFPLTIKLAFFFQRFFSTSSAVCKLRRELNRTRESREIERAGLENWLHLCPGVPTRRMSNAHLKLHCHLLVHLA